MNYIVLDLEWNCAAEGAASVTAPFYLDSEIIEIGAVRLNDALESVDEFRTFVHPTFLQLLNPEITKLTGIGNSDLEAAPSFPEAYKDFLRWCGEPCCLLVWGSEDLPVLVQNLLIHRLYADNLPFFCDLQRIFGHEVTKDERQWSLENALQLLSLRGDRFHDALCDARNTVLVLQKIPKPDFNRYCTAYIGCDADLQSGLIAGRIYNSAEEPFLDDAVTGFDCPYTGEHLTAGDWSKRKSWFYGRAKSSEGDEYLVTIRMRRLKSGCRKVTRRIFEMSDDLWEQYIGYRPLDKYSSILVYSCG